MPKHDAIVQSSLSRIDLAVCADYLNKHGYNPRNKSELIRVIVQCLANVILKNGGNKYESITDADEFLESIGITGLNPRYKGLRTFVGKLQLEALNEVEEDMDDDENTPQPKVIQLNDAIPGWRNRELPKEMEAITKDAFRRFKKQTQ